MARVPMVVGNWKMNASRHAAKQLCASILPQPGVETVIAPPFLWLAELIDDFSASGLAFAAQDVSAEQSGAFTGDIAASMLAELGCRYVIIGHSERRQYHLESDIQVAHKARAAQRSGLVPIICLGETLEQRERGAAQQTIGDQLRVVLDHLGVAAIERCVLAYEPVWAIGTGRSASPAEAQEAHAFLRGVVAGADVTIAQSLQILYGGSVKPGNAQALFSLPDVDGGLIGGASLVADEFNSIVLAACGTKQTS